MDDPERIWLEPGEGFYPTFGRTWCPADDWEGEGIEYIRADLAAAHTRAAVEAERAACEAVAWKIADDIAHEPRAEFADHRMIDVGRESGARQVMSAIAARKAQP
jgi:hypothetical protein